MTWVKKGRIYEAPFSHAQCPTVLVLPDRLRIFYADRTTSNRSFIAYADFDRGDLSLLRFHDDPIIDPGKPGTFDSDGMMPSCIVDHDGALYLYYSGWNQGVTVPYRNAIGLLVSEDHGKTWRRYADGPIMDRSVTDPYMTVTPWIMRQPGFWQMWYISGTGWGEEGPAYVIKHTRSLGIEHWWGHGGQSVAPAFPGEAFSNPTVWRDGDEYRMLFCSRGATDYRDGANAYRIRSAASHDGLTWTRTDEGIDVSPEGWDSTMTCYPYVVNVDGRLLCFYNGNGFGRTGIGYAEWQAP